jgi:hypothetical protein
VVAMNQYIVMIMIAISMFSLYGCSNGHLQPSKTVELGKVEAEQIEVNTTSEAELNDKEITQEVESKLIYFTDEEIEYAKVWLQLGVNQDIDELNVYKIVAGTKINEDDETSIVYPNDVIQLAGSRLIDGVVTYEKNEDGTIKVYNIPLRFDGINPAGTSFYEELLAKSTMVTLNDYNEADIISLIQIQNFHE